MEFSEEKIKNIKNILEKDHGREFTWEEAKNAMWDIERLAHIMVEVGMEEQRRQELLKENPKGFSFDRKGYSCQICGGSAPEGNSWFDKYGLKCMTCQKAINAKVIPGSVAKNEQSWYSKHELASYFNIKGADLNKYIKQSILKSRIIKDEKEKLHLQLFLISDNKDVLPPKKLFKPRNVKVKHNGEEYSTTEPWYEFADINLLKRLQKYKIIECLKETFAKPIEGEGRLLVKQISPIFRPK
ncbi:MAG: hypothetical protein HY841_03825 [Bacteroidetes bacterium]|nr:hypothetical protein [Bacteroidota bacterium]